MSIQELATLGNVQVTLTPQQLSQFAYEVARKAVADYVAVHKTTAERKQECNLVTLNDAAAMLGVTTRTLNRWEAANFLMPVRIGSKVYYNVDDINKAKSK